MSREVIPYLDYALPLAKSLHFFISPPIPLGQKHPFLKWKIYQSSPAQESELRNWAIDRFRKTPFNYGILTGPKPGYLILETDSPQADEIIRSRCRATPLIQRSGSRRGHHFIYRYPADSSVYVKTCSRIFVDGQPTEIDVRGVGGLAVGPGCMHKSGNRYEMLQDWRKVEPDSVPHFDPAWLGVSTAPPVAYVPKECPLEDLDTRQELAREFLAARPGATQGRGAERYAFRLAFELVHGFALSPEEAFPVFQWWGNRHDQRNEFGSYYPWTDDSLMRKLERAEIEAHNEGYEDGYLLPLDTTGIEELFKPVS